MKPSEIIDKKAKEIALGRWNSDSTAHLMLPTQSDYWHALLEYLDEVSK